MFNKSVVGYANATWAYLSAQYEALKRGEDLDEIDSFVQRNIHLDEHFLQAPRASPHTLSSLQATPISISSHLRARWSSRATSA